MIDAEDIILKHGSAPYDPVKRRERYLRTRQLKGRTRGSLNEGPTRTRAPKKTLPQRTPPASELSARRANRRKQIEATTRALVARFDALRRELRKLVELAQANSGIEPEQSTETTTKKAETAGQTEKREPQKQTAAQKKDAAKRSKEYYEEHKPAKPTTPKGDIKNLRQDIVVLEEKIMRARRFLKAAAADARANNSVTNRQ